MFLQHDVVSMWETAMKKFKTINEAAYSDYFNKVTPLRINDDDVWELGVSDDFFGDFITETYGGILSEVFAACNYPDKFRCIEGYEPQKKAPKRAMKRNQANQLTFDFGMPEESEIVEEKEVANNQVESQIIPTVIMDENDLRIEQTRKLSQQPIQSKHSFANFVVSEENREAFTAAKAVAEEPGLYNPLYIYGTTGTGKTHLLQAVANMAINNAWRVRYATCEELLNDFVAFLQQKKDMYAFRESVRNVDILLIDDVHLLSNKKSMQEEFFNMFNTLQACGRQIILTSDKQPCEIVGLEERLISRFESGLIIEIQPPSYEARLAILKQMRENKKSQCRISDAILEFIAQNISANVRRLKGAFIRVISYCTLKKIDTIALEKVEELLQTILSKELEAKTVSIEDIQKTVAEYFGLKLNDILGSKRPKNIAEARLIAMYLSRKHTTLSLTEIGQAFGKTHATILNAMQKVPEMNQNSEETRRNIMQIETALKRK